MIARIKVLSRACRWGLTFALSLVCWVVSGIEFNCMRDWTQAAITSATPIEATTMIIFAVSLMIFFLSILKLIIWLEREGRFSELVKIDPPGSRWDERQMNLARPLVEYQGNALFNEILSLKQKLQDVTAEGPGPEAISKAMKEVEEIRKAIRDKRAEYNKFRKLINKFGFGIRSERKRLKALSKQQLYQTV
jgi:hypothetical protein